jgi:hypothetical protein
MNIPESEQPRAEDTLMQLQKLVNSAEAVAASKVESWQNVHGILRSTKVLLESYAVDRKATENSQSAIFLGCQISHISETTFVPMALQLQDQDDAHTSKASAGLLLTSIQTSLSSNLADLNDSTLFGETKALLESASYPIQGAIESLRPLLSGFCPHFNTMLDSIAEDFRNSTNPLNLSNAAKNARELFTFLAREFQADDVLRLYPDVGLDDRGNPTRRSRLACYIYLGLPKSALPERWIATTDVQISALLGSFDELNKLTHINPETVSCLVTARQPIGEFIDNLVVCLKAREGTISLIVDALMEPVSSRLQEITEEDLQEQLEEGVSHAYGPWVWVDRVELIGVVGLQVSFSGAGSITCSFQIGSDGDVRRDEGSEFEGSRGLKFKGEALLGSTNRLGAFEDVTIEPEDCKLDDRDELTDEENHNW